jgi:hypothetical protein
MPQASNIVLADAAATPVNHTFIPMGQDAKGVFWFQDQSQASAIGYWRLSVELVRPPMPQAGSTSDTRVYRARIQLHEPSLANITNSTVTGVLPAPQLAYTVRGIQEFVLPERSALIDRQNISKMMPLALQNTQIRSVVEDLQFLY